jgi:replicative DNA helicase
MTEEIKQPPHAPGVEKAVLSVLLQWPETLDEVPQLTPEHFHLPGHRGIYEGMRERHKAGQSIELVQFVQYLQDHGKLERVGGASALADIYTYQPSPNELRNHIEALTQQLARRMALLAASELEKVAYESPQMEDLLDATGRPITAIHDTIHGTKPERTKHDVMEHWLNDFMALAEGRKSPMGIPTSLSAFNAAFRGLQGGQTIVIQALPGGGKTTLAMQLAADAAMAGARTRVFSLEMSAEALMSKLVAYAAGVPGNAVVDPKGYAQLHYGENNLRKKYLQKINRGAQLIKDSPLEIEDVSAINCYQIEARLRKSARKAKDEVVVIDYAQIIDPVSELRTASREQQIAHASKHLRHIRKEMGFCLILPSQVTRDGKIFKPKHCASINEDADVNLMLMQDDEQESEGIRCEKDRFQGNAGKLFDFKLDKPNLKFIEG